MEFLKINSMKNLENYGVQELSTVESQRTNGGIWPFVRAAAAVAFWHWDNWDDIKAGFESAQQ
jgi:hypothetical protein|tara:strand:+ start:113 stop:301 length:189 start_codon:yes stop_codon:yes gene_type:complete